MLWSRAENICSFPGCNRDLIVDATKDDKASFIGVECHIVASSDDWARGLNRISEEENAKYRQLIDDKDGYINLILLCPNHHKVIDDQPNTYTIEAVCTMKREHELKVRASLSTADEAKRRDQDVYASITAQW